MKIFRPILAAACLLLLCSCATTHEPSASSIDVSPVTPATTLPHEVAMNRDAGRGGRPLFVPLRLSSGKELQFFVDTGSPVTLFDKSLELELGECLGTTTFSDAGARPQKSNIYAAPELYLGNTRLITGPHVYSYDLRQLSAEEGRPIKAILGMDCLKHYCIQLDFEARKVRILNPDDIDAGELGQFFPLTFSSVNQPWKEFVCPDIHCANLAGGGNIYVEIDTGWGIDDAAVTKGSFWGHRIGRAHLQKLIWAGETYTNLTIWRGHVNVLGMRFLARHLVTFNFPKRMMYLKQRSVGPLPEIHSRSSDGGSSKLLKHVADELKPQRSD